MPSIHEKIRAARVRRGLTQLEAAQLAFISHRTYQRIEAGGTSPTADQLERIAAAFGCSVSDLFGSDVEDKDSPLHKEKESELQKENAQLRKELGHLQRTVKMLSNFLPDFLTRGGGR
ncbi:MAG: helix-turn-helix transcriptional regulator [Saprospiraceae bacterium]|nr:helix-turn-helix transcriptional regulator [Saprospiraceae bacterium]